jgi:hypothetical protein
MNTTRSLLVWLFLASTALAGGYEPLALKPKLWLAPRIAAECTGTLIDKLPDLSGHGRHATPDDPGNRPTLETVNGVPMAMYVGKRLDVASADWGRKFTMMCVVRPSGNLGSYIRIMEIGGWNVHSCYSVSNDSNPYRWWFEVKSSGMPGSVGAGFQNVNETMVLTFRFNGTNRTMRQNGDTYLSAAATTPTTTTCSARIGQAINGGYGFYGHIGDCIYWDRDLSDAECERVEGYLSDAYGICLRPRLAKLWMPAFQSNSDETLRLYGSNDGLNFGRIEATYAPTLGTMRDPSIVRRGSKLLLGHTLGAFNVPTTKFGIAECSEPSGLDKYHFTTVANVDCSSVVGCNQVWGAIWFVDPTNDSEHVITAISTNGNSGPFKHYELHPTNTERTEWSEPQLITGPGLPTNAIAAKIWHENGVYYLICKDENTARTVLCVSQKPLEGYVRVKTANWPLNWQVEGLYPVWFNGKRRLYGDDYMSQLGGPGSVFTEASSSNLETATFSAASVCRSPSIMRGGVVMERP